MRSKLLILAGCILLGACASIQETGISRSEAIRIAKQACPEYPAKFEFVDKAQWVPEKGFWSVELDDQSGYHGRVYNINRTGQVVGTVEINEKRPVVYYDVPPPAPYYYGGPYYGGPYIYGGPPLVIGVYGHGPYHRRW